MSEAGGGGARCVSRESEYVVEQERMSLNAGHSLRFFMGGVFNAFDAAEMR